MDDAVNENVVARQMPCDRVAEDAVVASMIAERSACETALEMLSKEDFYFEQDRALFDAASELYGKGMEIDPVTMQSVLATKNLPEAYADMSFINNLLAELPTSIRIKEYCTIVKSKALLRSIIKMNQKLETDCYRQELSVDEIIEATEKELTKLIRRRGVSDEVPIQQIVTEVLDRIQAASEISGGITGVPTGFIDLDYMTAGFQRSDLILIAARPSMGKTALALNIAEHVAFRDDNTVAVFSLEMSRDQIVNRLLSLETGIKAEFLRNGNLKDSDWDALMQGAGVISRSRLIIDDTPSISVSELRSKCRKYKTEKDLKLVIIDYLQLMTVGRNIESRQNEISEISRSLKAVARELDVPIVALSQLNRGVEQREDKRPGLADLRDSGAIEQDADVVMFIYRDDYYNHDSPEKGVSEIIIAKQRNGPVGTVKLTWHPQYTSFRNYTKVDDSVKKPSEE
ncbi:MAG: replicative DNA helicase [Lachnospiraceae bacterium]|nr:replicative DNA helicase [Lachnospiraceae bacterium]